MLINVESLLIEFRYQEGGADVKNGDCFDWDRCRSQALGIWGVKEGRSCMSAFNMPCCHYGNLLTSTIY
jgi:hypothetical protein